MSVKIEDLQPDVQEKVKRALREMDQLGIKYSIHYTLRTELEQIALYAQGRQPLEMVNSLRKTAGLRPIPASENVYTVTNCDGVKKKSAHQSGRAIDIVPLIGGRPSWPVAGSALWYPIADCMKRNGFTWGGDWKDFPDFPHFQA